jgi:sugar phosphate isomerase/epimerase
MPRLPIDTIIAQLAVLGYDGVEIAVLPNWSTELSQLDGAERRRIARLLRESGLALPAISSYLSTIEPDAAVFAQNLAYIHRAIDLAVDWAQGGRAPVVITGIGGTRGDLQAHGGRLVERLRALGDYAQGRGVTVALEAHIDAAVETPDQIVALLQEVASPAMRANFDISHFNVLGIPVEESVAKLVPVAAHAHVKDERGRHPAYAYLIPGEGEFDYVRYLKAMQAHGYTGAISVEISMQVQRRVDYDPLATAAAAYRVVAAAFDQAGVTRDA